MRPLLIDRHAETPGEMCQAIVGWARLLGTDYSGEGRVRMRAGITRYCAEGKLVALRTLALPLCDDEPHTVAARAPGSWGTVSYRLAQSVDGVVVPETLRLVYETERPRTPEIEQGSDPDVALALNITFDGTKAACHIQCRLPPEHPQFNMFAEAPA